METIDLNIDFFTADTLWETSKHYEPGSKHHMAIFIMPSGAQFDMIFNAEYECSPYIYQNEYFEAPEEDTVTEIEILEVYYNGVQSKPSEELKKHLEKFWVNEILEVL